MLNVVVREGKWDRLMLPRAKEAVLPVTEVREVTAVIGVSVDSQVMPLNQVVEVKQIIQDNKIKAVGVMKVVDVAVNRGVNQAVDVGINQ